MQKKTIMLWINGVGIPTPSAYEVIIADYDSEDSGRTASGVMQRDRIATKRKINMKWNLIKLEDMSKLLNLVSNLFFEVKYPDPYSGKNETRTFYVGDRTIPMESFKNGVPVWSNVAFNFIER